MNGDASDNHLYIEQLNAVLASSSNIVFFGGAGVSTESGIPDFRSAGGLYSSTRGGTRNAVPAEQTFPSEPTIPPEKILSHSFFMANTETFFSYYRANILHLGAAPNPAHLKLAEMERDGRLSAVVTQNIDGLHQKAGSKNVVELHGSVHRNNCLRCGQSYDVGYIARSEGVPTCDCGGIVKPGVVLYEESLNQDDIALAIKYIRQADVLIIGGTSLVVYPAAGLVQYYRGDKLIIINKSGTDSDSRALMVIRHGIGEVMSKVDIPKTR